ncbi:YiiG family protein [Pseudomonas sp. KNUC1026]|uniref:YiiG family protein n=1 Tax=Pseudomonas sp. KNUC1026 TaxID=2893890 RepID=UPI001F3A3BBD|nr:YiiG family protein [Pseudomonas sp. KNUC1026]UFH50812.1 YiiG family protein [Pseudomonas sp. KNUC1026]
MQAKSVWLGMLVAAGVLLSGCDDNKAPHSAATPQGQAEAPAPSAEQVEIEKYNAYVDAANSGGDFAAILEHRLAEYSKQLKSQNKLTEYYLFDVHDISNVRDNLKKALALPAPMPELDEPAKAMLVALEKLAPIHADLANYTESKGWLADDGKKAKEMEPALDAALEAVAVEQAKFYDGLSKRDEINVKHAFDAAEKDSLAYYNAGFVLYGKQAMRLSREFFKSAGADATIQPFADSLDKTAQMVEGWQKKNTSKSPSCTVLPSRMNQFVAKGRQAISTAKAGGYKYDEQRQMAWKNDNPIQRDAKFFGEAFDNVIRDMNSSQCD